MQLYGRVILLLSTGLRSSFSGDGGIHLQAACWCPCNDMRQLQDSCLCCLEHVCMLVCVVSMQCLAVAVYTAKEGEVE